MKSKEELLKMTLGEILVYAKSAELKWHCIDCTGCENCQDCQDCEDCVNCKYCFACSHISGGKYMICNVQFTKEEYMAKI